MKSNATVGAASMFAALIAALALLFPDSAAKREETAAVVDPITSGSISHGDATETAEMSMVRFTVSNLDADTVCLVARGAVETARSSNFSADDDCDAVWPGLATARSWVENGDGSVTLTDDSGTGILTMRSARGFDYATIEPSGVDITWLELP